MFQAKRREAASLDRQVLLKKLRDVLDTLKGRVAGRNRDDAEEAISLVNLFSYKFLDLPITACCYKLLVDPFFCSKWTPFIFVNIPCLRLVISVPDKGKDLISYPNCSRSFHPCYSLIYVCLNGPFSPFKQRRPPVSFRP